MYSPQGVPRVGFGSTKRRAVAVVAGAVIVAGVAVSELPPNPEATNKSVSAIACFLTVRVCHPPQSEAQDDGWFAVRDLDWLDDDGYLFPADRRTDLIITRDSNIRPAEIERDHVDHRDARRAACCRDRTTLSDRLRRIDVPTRGGS